MTSTGYSSSNPATLRLDLPLMAPAQAQKHITHNEALVALDRVVQLSVVSTQSAPPALDPDSVEGALEAYLIDQNASGDWQSRDGQIAFRETGAWVYLQPKAGWRCWDAGRETLLVYGPGGWAPVPASGASTFGVNTQADVTNRLAVRSPATLLTAEDQDHRLVINRSAPGGVASTVFQTNYTGQAEFGLFGAEQFAVKVSGDGTAFQDAISIQVSTADVSISEDLSVGGRIYQDGNSVLDSENTPSPIADRGTLDVGDDLNTFKTSGYWAQTQLSGPDMALNYPIEARGVLLVIRAWVMVFQTYYVIANAGEGEGGAIYTRALFGTNWTPWTRMATAQKNVLSLIL